MNTPDGDVGDRGTNRNVNETRCGRRDDHQLLAFRFGDAAGGTLVPPSSGRLAPRLEATRFRAEDRRRR